MMYSHVAKYYAYKLYKEHERMLNPPSRPVSTKQRSLL